MEEFVKADSIAQGLSVLRPETVALAAGRVMLARLEALAAARKSFAFETTLASRSFAPRLRSLQGRGFRVHLAFLALPEADLAVARVADRVRRGGHDVPEPVIRRRFGTSSRLTSTWPTPGRCSTTRFSTDRVSSPCEIPIACP